MAEIRIDELDRSLPRARVAFAFWSATALLLLGVGCYLVVRHHSWFVLIYCVWWFIRAYSYSPMLVRRQRRRAEAALVANAAP
jgi:hypothetical protein